MNLNEITSLDQLEPGKKIEFTFGYVRRASSLPSAFVVFKNSSDIFAGEAICLDEGWVSVRGLGTDYKKEAVMRHAKTPIFPTLGALVAYLVVFYESK